MSEIFKGIPAIRYEGPESKNPLAFKFYDADKDVFGKKMSEHLPFDSSTGSIGSTMSGK